jgi:hypothetical protein
MCLATGLVVVIDADTLFQSFDIRPADFVMGRTETTVSTM